MKQIMLNVDNVAMFDLVKMAGDNGAALGSRLAMMLMANGEMAAIEAIGLAAYGITVETVRDVEPAPALPESGRVAVPFAYCCSMDPATCDCVNPDHGTAWVDAPPPTGGVGQ